MSIYHCMFFHLHPIHSLSHRNIEVCHLENYTVDYNRISNIYYQKSLIGTTLNTIIGDRGYEIKNINSKPIIFNKIRKNNFFLKQLLDMLCQMSLFIEL
ncbi:hypothetical protein BpHYR1_031396 [Brachionus plicatilis]|uniref:Uncharacterized protein n=1 Tax=Brachionus plicatilis TaxID=10195 RepID=A0A3M7RW32_BRAPC|nr:hypothetical protein BpHYR1_031396 [Brachionus plicatilis]